MMPMGLIRLSFSAITSLPRLSLSAPRLPCTRRLFRALATFVVVAAIVGIILSVCARGPPRLRANAWR